MYGYPLFTIAGISAFSTCYIEGMVLVIPGFLIYLLASVIGGWVLMELVIWRVGIVNKRKKEVLAMQMEYAQLENKALRSQMNPHFIFNSLNSIKLLVQENQNSKAAEYLTTFTKLMRGLLMNAEKNTVTLATELDTCRLYLSLESLRFNEGFEYSIQVSDKVDLSSVEVPVLIVQPFVENAIWHGLMTKQGERKLSITVTSALNWVICTIDDNGIGRKAASENNNSPDKHKSKGIGLTLNRLILNDKLYDRQTKVEIKDKYDKEGNPLGTRVEIMFEIND